LFSLHAVLANAEWTEVGDDDSDNSNVSKAGCSAGKPPEAKGFEFSLKSWVESVIGLTRFRSELGRNLRGRVLVGAITVDKTEGLMGRRRNTLGMR